MKPVFLNLLAEEQMAARATANDPVKTAGLIAAGLLVLVGAVGFAANWRAGGLTAKYADLEAHQAKVTKQADEGTGDLRTWRLLANDIQAIHESRALFAWQLAWIKDIVPPTIQVSKISLGVDGAPSPKKGSTAGASVENVLLRLDGVATGRRPEMEVDNFLKAIESHPGLKDKVQEAKLGAISRRAQSDPTALPVADFVIECRYRGNQ